MNSLAELIVTLRYLADSTRGIGEKLIDTCTCILMHHLEIFRKELFGGLMANYEDVIQLDKRSTSC